MEGRIERAFFDPQQDWEGQYTVKANFTLNKPASHDVAYGLFAGGQDMEIGCELPGNARIVSGSSRC